MSEPLSASPSDAETPPPPGASQLSLPLPDVIVSAEPISSIARGRRVFVNRNIHLADVDWIGFDMDYTLAIYDQSQMDELQIRATLPRLVARGYPSFLLELDYDASFPIRGLMIDKKLGHILKMDRYKSVHKAWHGLKRLDRQEIKELYEEKKIRLTPARYHWIDTLYALAEVTIYAAVIDALEKRGAAVDFSKLFDDIRQSIDEAHRDGTILDAVAADFPRFVRRDPDLAPALHKWRSAGKKLFLLTNSRWSYTDKMMSYLVGGVLPEYPSWRNFFDAVVAAAGKPGFFQEKRPLLEREGDETRPAGATLERGRIYENGNLHDFERLLGTSGDRVLYVGDHIYGDILRSKKESTWRTCMIIQEMVDEVSALEAGAADITQLEDLEDARAKAEDELRHLQQRFKDLSRQLEIAQAGGKGLVVPQVLEAERLRVKRRVERVRALRKTLDAQVIDLEARIDSRFHPYWGSLLKEGAETSSFGNQIEEYACLYTSRVSNFLHYSPIQHFRSPRDRMPHEL